MPLTMDGDPGNRDYLCAQVGTHLDRLYGAALRLTRHHSDAEDLVADTVERALSAIDTLQDRERLVPWLLRIMTNTFISSRRGVEQRTSHESYEEEGTDDDAGFSIFERLHQPFLLWWSNPEQEFLNQLLQEDVAAALTELPEGFRIVVVLADVEGLTYQEIAESLEVPVGTVRSRLARGRGMLQKALWHHARDRGLVTDEQVT